MHAVCPRPDILTIHWAPTNPGKPITQFQQRYSQLDEAQHAVGTFLTVPLFCHFRLIKINFLQMVNFFDTFPTRTFEHLIWFSWETMRD